MADDIRENEADNNKVVLSNENWINAKRLAEIYKKSFLSYISKVEPRIRKKKYNLYIRGLRNRIFYGNSGKAVCNVIPDIRGEYLALKHFSKNEVKNRKSLIDGVVKKLAIKEIDFLSHKKSWQDISDFLDYLEKDNKLVNRIWPIEEKYSSYENRRIREQILDLVQTDPTVEFPKTRQMDRHFYLHLGPTNSGKTYESIQRLKSAKHGVYLGPLRLLALEIYDTLTDAGVKCSMITGEEHINVEDCTVFSQTIETLDIEDIYDVAVIDEGQMINDTNRGHAWSRAVLGVKAKEVHVCASTNVEALLVGIIKACGDSYEIIYHERKTELTVEDTEIDLSPENINKYILKGDCLITFSKKTVMDLAARLEMAGIKVSVIYGKLPPENRKKEVYRFTKGETDVVVATDAIGMGVNLPIRRIVMTANQKYDGKEQRKLLPDEVYQIVGRAGRFGIYETGYVTSTIPGYNEKLRRILSNPLPDISRARLGFPKVLLDFDEDLDAIIRTWESIKANPPYEKISTKEMLYLYDTLKIYSRSFAQVPDGDDNHTLFGMISVPIDIGNPDVVKKWVDYCKNYAATPRLAFPELPYMRKGHELEAYETYYKLLDLYHLFSIHMGKDMEEERLRSEKDWTQERIESIIIGSKNKFVRRCRYCGMTLPLEGGSRFCEDCFAIRRMSYEIKS